MLKINQLTSINNKNSISFAGHHLSENDKGEKTYKFYIPKVNYDNATLLLRKVQLDDNGKLITDEADNEIAYKIPKDSAQVEINPKKIGLSSSEALVYRFVIDGKEYTDKHRNVNINSHTYNIATLPYCDVLQTPKTMYHLMPGIFNPKLVQQKYTNALGEEVLRDDKTAQINHFMKFDTSIDDIISKIPYIKNLGFRRILSTPIFGQDNISNAGYWTVNPFQITQRFGTIKDFEKLQIELFKNSMGFVADGAFTAEGLSGIHFRDVLRNGKDSPFYRWFKLKGDLKLGVLSDKAKVYENFDIRVVNSPIIWAIDKNGYPTNNFGKRNPKYNSQKETFIQLYDKRLTSQAQLAKDEVFTSYDIKNTKDKDEISNWMDSTYPYAFPVSVNELLKKAKNIQRNRKIPAKEFLKSWENFELSEAKESSGVSLWTGNKDMAKLRFTLPAYKQKEIMADATSRAQGIAEVKSTIEAAENVQNYVVSIGKFWTNKTAKTLRGYIAKELSDAKTANEFKRTITAKAGKKLPESMKYLTTQQIQNALDNEYKVNKTLYTPKTLSKSLKEYPMEALEVSDDITSIFAYPSFKEKADKYLYETTMNDAAMKIFQKLDKEKLACGKLTEDGDIKLGKEKIVQLISDDISRFLLLKGLLPSLDIQDILDETPLSLEKLKNITAKRICSETNNVEEKEEQLLAHLKRNIRHISEDDINKFVKHLKSKLNGITPETIKVADLIIDKSEAGLNWRMDAAKDVAGMEAFGEGRTTLNESWGVVADFWNKFNAGVRLYNAHSYKIGEFTDTSIHNTETSDKYQNAGDLESKLIEENGFTTQSNYNYLFDSMQRFFSAPSERYSGLNTNALELIFNKFEKGWTGVPGYLYSGNKNNIVYSHAAVGNHDKQRITQSFSMNMALAFLDATQFINCCNSDNYWRKIADEINKDLLDSNLRHSCVFSAIQNRDWQNIFKFTTPKNLAKMAAYNDAFAKATNSSNTALQQAFSNALDKLCDKRHKYSDTFYYKNFENTFDDILMVIDAKYKNDVENLKIKVHKELTEPARIRGMELARLMVALPANPTLFAGDELLELGGEEKAKNISLQNRNRLHWENAKYSHVSDYIAELSKIYNLRNDAKLTSLVNGDSILLKKQGDTIGGREVLGMYRYNDKDDCIVLMHNSGFNSSRNFKQNTSVSINRIDLSEGDVNYATDGAESKENHTKAGLPNNGKFTPGTKFVDALDSSKKYVVGKDGYLYSKNKKAIVLNHTVTILKREE